MIEKLQTLHKSPLPPLCTITGEFYQPARIYYQVNQKNAVMGRFKRLRCMEFDPTDNRWMWLYKEEAKDIKFTTSYRDIPKEARPIILGSFTWHGDQELRLDVHSFERVIESIQFFDQKINRKLATVTKLKVVNKLFPATTTADELSTHHHLFFEQRQAMGPKTTIKELEEIASQYEGKEEEERHTAFLSYLEEQMKKTLPEVEELATHFYEDGLQSLLMPLKMKQLEAMEHWKGNKNFSQFDIIKKFIQEFDLDE